MFGLSLPEDPRKSLSSIPWNNASNHVLAVQNAWKYRCSPCTSGHLNGKFDSVWDGKIVNCGMTRKVRLQWRLNWAENILPALYKFNPDLIIISAGFDAHFQDEINHGFVSSPFQSRSRASTRTTVDLHCSTDFRVRVRIDRSDLRFY